MDNTKIIPNINKLKNRLLRLSPTVEKGLEKECLKEDFFSEGDRPIGKGGFGQVWKVRHKATDKIYVIKVLNKQSIIEQKMVDQIQREIDIMYLVNHPHIIKLINHFEDDENIYLVMNYASRGQLYSLLKKSNRFDQRTAAQYMRELISALKYLHSFKPPIIHRDIKPENVLLDENGRVKLADFGWSNFEDKSKRTTYCGTPEYLAPEMIKKEGHDTTIDIWDLGVLLFELLSGRPPFSGTSQNELFLNIKKHKINWPDDFPPLAKNLISKILRQNPKERISLDEILAHAWFEKNTPLRPVLTEDSIPCGIETNLLNNTSLKQNANESKKKESSSQNLKAISPKLGDSLLKSNKAKELLKETTLNDIMLEDSEKKNLQNLIEELKKEINELKTKLEKSDQEMKNLRAENLKLRDNQNKMDVDNELYHLKDELNKYKLMNKDRLALLTEIEEKNNEIVELKNKMNTIETENENNKRNLKLVTVKYNEESYLNQANEIKINDLMKQLELSKKDRESSDIQFQHKLELLQVRLLENPDSSEVSEIGITHLLQIINEGLNELKTLFLSKTKSSNELIEEYKTDKDKFEKKIEILINDRFDAIASYFSKIRNSIEDDVSKISTRISENNNSSCKSIERIEWFKRQINELMPYKIKSSNLEIQVTKLESSIAQAKEREELYKTKLYLLEKLNDDKDFKLNHLKKYIFNVEARLSDIKDFLIKSHPDYLEEFKKSYKI